MMQQYMRKVAGRRVRGRLTRAITRPPFQDELGRKGWLAKVSRAQRHVIRRLHLKIAGWPQWRRPLRVAYVYGARAVIDALEHHGIPVLDHARRSMRFQSHAIDLVGVPDAGMTRAEAYALLAGLSAERPTIVLAHDPVWFAHLPTGPHFMLAGHTHGGQIKLPGIGIVRTATKAPRRCTYGLVE